MTLRKLAFLSFLATAMILAGCRSSGSASEGQMEEGQMEEGQMEEGQMMENATSFTVRIENVSKPGTIDSDRAMGAVPLSPGVWAVHSGRNPFFTPGQPASAGLELLAEDGFPMMLAGEMKKKMQMAMEEGEQMEDESMEEGEEMMEAGAVTASGVFAQPVGKDMNAPLKPGDAYEFTIQAQPGQRLSFATMFVQSNDLFYSPGQSGLSLFDGGQAMSGSMTSEIQLWDAGTEEDTAPGTGPNQKPAQGKKARDVGPGEDAPVQLASRTGDGFQYPAAGQVIRVTVTSQR